MKTVMLTPTDHRDPSNEEHTVYSVTGKKDGFASLDQFFFATVATGVYPKDERWYRKQSVPAPVIMERLRAAGIEEVGQFASAPILEAIITCDEAQEFDCHFVTAGGFLRYLCYSTA